MYTYHQGMVEAGDTVSATLKKEFGEEAMNSIEASEEEKKRTEQLIEELFHSGTQVSLTNPPAFKTCASPLQIYAGYVDDPRNTDNAWMETVAFNFHDETGTSPSLLLLPLLATLTASIHLSLPLYSLTPPGDAFSRIKLQAGDDAGAVKWTEISRSLDLYASHTQLVQEVVKLRNAAW